MGNLNLDLKSRQVFGEYLPSVYIGRTTIEEITGAEAGFTAAGAEDSRILKISSELSIYFSKDESIETLDDAKEWIERNLGDLYLYTIRCPIKSLNEKLEKSQLDLRDLFATIFYGYGEIAQSTFDINHAAYEIYIGMIKEWFLSGYRSVTTGYDGSGATLADLENPESDYYESFWGAAGPSGPWEVESAGYVGAVLDIVFQGLTESQHRGADYPIEYFHKTPLIDLVDYLIEKNVYDNDGNEILQIAITAGAVDESDAPLPTVGEFITKYDATSANRFIQYAEKVFIIAFVGRDHEELQNEDSALYNANFGDITYEHILENNAVPDYREEIFVEVKDGSPYNGMPIQTLEQKYYIPQPVSQKIILKNLETLLSAFSEWKEEDEALKENSNNLAYIMQTKGKDIDLIPQLQLFRRTYPDKSSITKSGQMYAEFKKVLYTFNKKVALQTEVKKQLVMNTKTIDMRIKALNMYYLMPNPSFQASQIDGSPAGGDPEGSPGWDLTPYVAIDGLMEGYECKDLDSKGIASDVYIPSQWSRMARNAVLTTPQGDLVGDFYEFAVEEGYLDAAGRPIVYENVFDTAVEDYLDMSEADLWGWNEAQAVADIVVANKGIFFFDWEKALHTQSHIAHIFRISTLQRLFHFTIPYKYFKVLKATLIREEKMFATQMAEGEMGEGWHSTSPFWGEESGYVEIKIECFMRDKSLPGVDSGDPGTSVPWTKKVNYWYDPENLKYGQPWVYNHVTTEDELYTSTTWETATMTTHFLEATGEFADDALEFGRLGLIKGTSVATKSYSYLKFKNFDVAQPSFPGSLHGTRETDTDTGAAGYWRYGPLKYYGSNDAGGFNNLAGLRIKDSYRLMCFEYCDYMDDDVAFYSTIGEIEGVADHVRTNYCVKIEVEDRSLQLYDYLYQKLYDEWENFVKNYYEFAIEWCSYNNITDRFNDFFRDAMYKQFPVDTEKPWVRAVYYFNVWRALVFRSWDSSVEKDSDLEILIAEDTRLWIDKMGPDNGTVENLKMFAELFSRLVYRFKPDAEVGRYCDLTASEASEEDFTWQTRIFNRFLERAGLYEDYASGHNPERDFYGEAVETVTELVFANILPIDQPIYGDLGLSAYYASDFEPDLDTLITFEETTTADLFFINANEIYITAAHGSELTTAGDAHKRVWVEDIRGNIREITSRDWVTGAVVAGVTPTSEVTGRTPFKFNPQEFFEHHGLYHYHLGWIIRTSELPQSLMNGVDTGIEVDYSSAVGNTWLNWSTTPLDPEYGPGPAADSGWETFDAPGTAGE